MKSNKNIVESLNSFKNQGEVSRKMQKGKVLKNMQCELGNKEKRRNVILNKINN